MTPTPFEFLVRKFWLQGLNTTEIAKKLNAEHTCTRKILEADVYNVLGRVKPREIVAA